MHLYTLTFLFCWYTGQGTEKLKKAKNGITGLDYKKKSKPPKTQTIKHNTEDGKMRCLKNTEQTDSFGFSP